MSTLLHISASPRREASQSLRIAERFLDTYRQTHPDDTVLGKDLWHGTLPHVGPAAAGATMTIFGGGTPEGAQAAAWQAAHAAFARFDAADRLLFSVPMWNAGIPYILKQFIDVVSQPATLFGIDPATGYIPLLAGRGKRAAVIYTSAVYGPALGVDFGRDFQSTYVDDWLRWTGIDDVNAIRYHPTLTGDPVQAMLDAQAAARDTAATF